MALVDQDSAQVRFPPPLVVLGCLLAGLALDRVLGLAALDIAVLRPVGVVIGALGAAILGSGLIGFFRAGNDPEPWKKDTQLVTSGLYRFSRNPMYLAMAAILTGGAFLMGNLSAFVAPILFVWLMTEFQIKPEERALQARFGEAFDAYRIRTRRWI